MRARPAHPSSRRAPAAAAALVIAALAALFCRHLTLPSRNYDEQVYLGSASALAHGARLGRDLFASQPPLWFALLHAAHGLAAGHPAAMRALAAAAALGGCLAGAALARALAGGPAAVAALALVGLAFSRDAGEVGADVPSVALGLAALAALGGARRRPWLAALAGGLLALAVLVKLLAAPFVVGAAVAAWSLRLPARTVGLAALGAVAVAAGTAVAYADVLGLLWHQAVGFHLHAGGSALAIAYPGAAAAVFAALGGALALGLGLAPPRAAGGWARERAPLLATLAAAVVLLAYQRPLFDHHLVVAAAPLAVLAASALPPRPGPALAIALGALALALGLGGRVVLAPGQRAAMSQAAALVRQATPARARVAGDLPLVAVLAGRPPAPETVDASFVRVAAGRLPVATFRRAARGAGAVVLGRALRRYRTELPRGLCRRARFGGLEVWLRRRCPGRAGGVAARP